MSTSKNTEYLHTTELKTNYFLNLLQYCTTHLAKINTNLRRVGNLYA